MKILTYLVINHSVCLGTIILIEGVNDICLLGVIPKVVMDSMEFLKGLHLVNGAQRGHKKRHSFKGKKKKNVGPVKKWHCYWLFLSVFFNFIFPISFIQSDAVCEDGAFDSREAKGQPFSR